MVLSDYLFDIWIGFPRRLDQEERFVRPLDVILPPVDCFHLRQHLNACGQAALDQQVRQPLAILLSLCRSQHDQSVARRCRTLRLCSVPVSGDMDSPATSSGGDVRVKNAS